MSENKGSSTKRAVFSVTSMDCVTCALAIGKKLRKLDGIKEVGSAVMLNKIFVDYDDSKVNIREIKRAIKDSGYSNYVTSHDYGHNEKAR